MIASGLKLVVGGGWVGSADKSLFLLAFCFKRQSLNCLKQSSNTVHTQAKTLLLHLGALFYSVWFASAKD